MALSIASWFLAALALYGLFGLLFGLRFVALQVQRIDPSARGAGWAFRLLILPGVIALWPCLLRRQRAAESEPAP